MNTIYILIMVFTFNYDRAATNVVAEFNSKESCLAAANAAIKQLNSAVVVVCAAKGEKAK